MQVKAITCEKFREQIEKFFDGLLDEVEDSRINTHMKQCKKCQEASADILIKRMKEKRPPEEVAGNIAKRVGMIPNVKCFSLSTLREYVSKDLTKDEETLVKEHVRSCWQCRAIAENMRKKIDLGS